MISYSVSISLIILSVIFLVGSVDLFHILESQYCYCYFYALLPIGIRFMISAIAETNRAPFDLPEAESELVAGFFTEHSAVSFACFFLGEYTNMVTISTLFFVLFFGSSLPLPPLPIAVVFVLFMIWIRASLARLRFDQLVHLGWAHILPFTIGYILFLPCLLLFSSLSLSIRKEFGFDYPWPFVTP